VNAAHGQIVHSDMSHPDRLAADMLDHPVSPDTAPPRPAPAAGAVTTRHCAAASIAQRQPVRPRGPRVLVQERPNRYIS
ncbi:hypothetical protein, partial [Rhodoplanes serenus]|uniref:hypothetical protein n=1 Tax=Rhodoplanes serenus TaxID=200615 RepID=UPI001AEC9B44